jgi:hypothetical protein
MRMEMESRFSDTRSIDAALERLRKDLFDPDLGVDGQDEVKVEVEGEVSLDTPSPIDYSSLEFEVERMRKRLAIWEVFMTSMRDGARSWPQVQRSLTEADFNKIVAICDGVPLRDLLLDTG